MAAESDKMLAVCWEGKEKMVVSLKSQDALEIIGALGCLGFHAPHVVRHVIYPEASQDQTGR
jgi:hypothetical protein